MIAAKTRMQSAHLLERVDHRCRREGARRQPAARIRKQTGNSREHRADRGQAYDETGLWQFREGRLIRFGEFCIRAKKCIESLEKVRDTVMRGRVT